jgi:hypothetical protein
MKTLALFAALTFTVAPVQEMPQPPAPSAQHAWLQQLVGEWSVTSEIMMGPDAPPMKVESTESVRSIGGLWVLAEGKMPMGETPMTTLLTLGYDLQEKAYVGTWVDTMQTHMWVYRGTLDDAQKTLTLESTGPSFDDPTQTAKYRDAITIVGADQKRWTSTVLGDDGEWTQYLTADYRRKK